jgi:hypothetical protein
MLPLTPRSSKWALSSLVSPSKLQPPFLSIVCATGFAHFVLLDHPNIWWGAETIKLFTQPSIEVAIEIIFREQHHLTMEISPPKLHVSIIYIFIRIVSFLLNTRAKYHKLLFSLFISPNIIHMTADSSISNKSNIHKVR